MYIMGDVRCVDGREELLSYYLYIDSGVEFKLPGLQGQYLYCWAISTTQNGVFWVFLPKNKW